MKFKTLRAVFTLVLLLVMGVMIVGFALRTGIASVSAASVKHGELLVTKECSAYCGQAGEFCTITSSTLWQIKVGSTLSTIRRRMFRRASSTATLFSTQATETGRWAVAPSTWRPGRDSVLFSDGHRRASWIQCARRCIAADRRSPLDLGWHIQLHEGLSRDPLATMGTDGITASAT